MTTTTVVMTALHSRDAMTPICGVCTPPDAWLPIPGVVGYEISRDGRVRSVQRTIVRRNGAPYPISSRVLTPQVDRCGLTYYRLGIGRRGHHRWLYVNQKTIDRIFATTDHPDTADAAAGDQEAA